MSLISPERLIWLWVALPVIGFYILKTRLRRRSVATLLFWDQVFEEKRQRSLWQNLRHWLSLLLQLAVVALVVFALVDPTRSLQSDTGQELILIVDNSASMQVVDPLTNRSRLQDAIDQADQIAAGLRQGDQAALMTAGCSIRVVTGMTDFAPAIREGLSSIEPTDGPTRVIQAIGEARRLSNDVDRRRMIVFSDVCLPDRNSVPVAHDLRWVQVGTSTGNTAITAYQARRSIVDPLGWSLLIELRNFSDQAAEGRLKLTLNDALVDVIPYSLQPDGEWHTTIEGTSREGGVLTAAIDADDGLTVDNVARAIVPARPLVPVRLVAENDDDAYYLRTVLESIPLLQVTSGDEADAASGVLTVFSGISPNNLPDGPALVVAAQQSGPLIDVDGVRQPAWTVGEPLEATVIVKQHEDSPVLRHVRLQNVLLNGGRDINVSESLGTATSLLETAEGARVLVSVERPAGRMLILAADLNASDLPLRIAFPVMMTNAINWFLRQDNELSPSLATGQAASVGWDIADGEKQSEAVLVDTSGGRRFVTVAENQAAVGAIDRTGIMGLFAGSSLPKSGSPADTVLLPQDLIQTSPPPEGKLIAVNLCDASESDLRLADLSPQSAGELPPAGVPIWFYLVLLAIGLVVGEWALFNRRIIA